MARRSRQEWRDEKIYWDGGRTGDDDDQSRSSSRSSTREREELARMKAAIAREENDLMYDSATSSTTREELAAANRRLETLRQRSASGSATREELARVNAAIAREENNSTYGSASSQDKIREANTKLLAIKSRKHEISRLFEMLKLSESVDLCFLVDCTGSMASYITEVKSKIREIIEQCKDRFDGLQFRIAFIGYRDHGDGKDRITSLKFSPCIDNFRQYLEDVKAKGGQDGPEDVFGGLEQVGKMEWKAPTRILFHISDAPCHGTRFHDMGHDDYPRGDPRGLRVDNLLHRLQELKIVYWFAELTPHTRKMLGEFQNVMDGKIKEVQLKSAANLLTVVVDSVSETLSEIEEATIADFCKTIEDDDPGTKVPNRTRKSYDLVKDIPTWHEIPTEEVIVLKNRLPASIEMLRQTLVISTGKRRLKIAGHPFDEGAQRVAYYGLDVSFSEDVLAVFKEFKYHGDNYNTKEKYLKQMEIQSVSAYLAQHFNRIKPSDNTAVLFTKIQVVTFNKREKPFYCTKESLIRGKYVKFNSNCGYVNKDEYTDTLNAFSHWTHHVTRGYLMVIDLQGVKVEDGKAEKYILTDPSIHCLDVTRFGKTNLGKPGMLRFFRSHKCSIVCQALGLPHVSSS